MSQYQFPKDNTEKYRYMYIVISEMVKGIFVYPFSYPELDNSAYYTIDNNIK